MMDAEDFDFVCPHRICHKRQTADAHTIANLRGELQRALAQTTETLDGRRSLPAGALDSGSPIDVARDATPKGAAFGKRDFSDFIRNASVEEKTEVYTEVMEKASERQRNAIPMNNGSTLEFRDYGDEEQLKSVRDELDKSK